MRSVAFGHGHYFAWHFPTMVLVLVSLSVLVAVGRQLWRGHYGPEAKSLRWSVVGWCSLAISVGSAVIVPYLRDAAYWRVESDGAWSLRNYLGFPVARIDASEVRMLRARDLGGLGVGMGRVEVHREDGRVVRTVRMTRARVNELTRVLGYARSDLAQEYADAVVRPHRYAARFTNSAACAFVR